ncbi:uncharacterized protein LOC118938870 isoform X1 [Oncorhynchus mykiss]|uniref:uncharacterized protein LOC118938870 isoform X1 n=2 Tax=Oncorhynchus mykiss TaxID=8022 RepID=UPI0018787472|nr:uncharacterized protein LOC118938870 isoform X1 [Oncorhynchus mykiss]
MYRSVGRMSLLLCCIVMALHLATGLDAAPGVANTTEEEVEGVDSQSPCPAGWHQNEHRCFSFYPVWATWATAELYCSQHRGNLVSVHSPGQQVFVQDLVRRHTDQPVWMGGYDAAQEGMWLWSDGSAVDSFYWEEDEPSNSGQGENCMELHTGGGQGWNDVSCAELRFYVCSMETRSGLASLPSQKKKHERELVEEVSIYDVLWETSERVADEILYSAFLRGMYSRRLPARCYADFCHQEVLYLDRVIPMLRVLIRTVQGPPDIMLFLQRTHQRYQESLKEAQNQTPPHLNLSSIQPSAAVRQYLQSFHDIVNEEPIYWLVSLLPRALLRPYLAQNLPLGERSRPGPSPCVYPWLSLFPCPCYQWGGEDMKPDQRNQKDKSGTYYRHLLEKYQDVIDVYKAVNIFRVQMINEKALFTSSWFPTGDEEEEEDQPNLLSVESGPDVRVKL